MKYAAIVIAVFVTSVLAGSTLADTVYRWVDAQGHVHYSQTPPHNAHVKSKAVTISPPPPDKTSVARTKDMEQAVHDHQEAQKALAEHAQQQTEKKAKQQEACQTARERVQRYTNAHRVAVRNKEGQVDYSSGDDLVKLRQQAEAEADKLCNETDGGG